MVEHGPDGSELRAGQVVEVDWVEAAQGDVSLSATRVVRRGDLQTRLGG